MWTMVVVILHQHLQEICISSNWKLNIPNTVVIPFMVIEIVNLEEQLTGMKAKLDRLSKENVEQKAQIGSSK